MIHAGYNHSELTDECILHSKAADLALYHAPGVDHSELCFD